MVARKVTLLWHLCWHIVVLLVLQQALGEREAAGEKATTGERETEGEMDLDHLMQVNLFQKSLEVVWDHYALNLSACDGEVLQSMEFAELAIGCQASRLEEEADCTPECKAYYQLSGVECEQQHQEVEIRVAQQYIDALDSGVVPPKAAGETLSASFRPLVLRFTGSLPPRCFLCVNNTAAVEEFADEEENSMMISMLRAFAENHDEEDEDVYLNKCIK